MGNDCGSWHHQQHSAWQPPNLNCTRAPLEARLQNTFPAYANPFTYKVSANGALPGFAVSELPHVKTAQSNGPHGWFYCLPRHRQALSPSPNYIAKEKFSGFPYGCNGELTPNVESGPAQKKFLVFDQSGNQTNLIFSSEIGPTFQHLSSKTTRPFDTHGLHEELVSGRVPIHQSGHVILDGLDENQGTDDGSEMHEDTEELNALLYSDDSEDDYDDDDEVTSTGHSPSEVTGHEKREHVDSMAGPNKRIKLVDGGYEVSSLMDSASSAKPNGPWEYEDDAESGCRTEGREMGLSLGDKQSRKERIRETVNILRSIIPGGKGKDAVLVLDEAIQYLRSLKLKAAEALGASAHIK